MTLRKIALDAKKLKSVHQGECAFFVLFQILLSEVMILHKLLILCVPEHENEILEKANNAQSLFFLRMLAGKLFEGWELMAKLFFGSGLSMQYEPLLCPDSKSCLESLKSYFGRSNPLSEIRNTFAFHFADSSQEIVQQIRRLNDSEPLELYIAPEEGNCLYDMGHVLFNLSLLDVVGGSDLKDAIEKLWKDVLKVAKWFVGLGQGIIVVFVDKHLGYESEQVEIPDPPHFSEVRIPYFLRRIEKSE